MLWRFVTSPIVPQTCQIKNSSGSSKIQDKATMHLFKEVNVLDRSTYLLRYVKKLCIYSI